jgi:hypothetical protein
MYITNFFTWHFIVLIERVKVLRLMNMNIILQWVLFSYIRKKYKFKCSTVKKMFFTFDI